MKIIAVANQKGGAGKTTTALNFALGLAASNRKILLIDMDGQCNLSFLLGIPNDTLQNSTKNIYSVLIGKYPITDCIISSHGVDIVPASPALYEADLTINKVGKEYKLKKALSAISDYDYIILDTCPSLGILTVNAFTAADCVIIPVQAELLSLVGLQQLAETLDAVKEYCNPHLQINGILVNRYQGRARLSQDFMGALQQQAEMLGTKVYAVPIRESITVKEAQSLQQSIYEYGAKSAVTQDYHALIAEFLKGEKQA